MAEVVLLGPMGDARAQARQSELLSAAAQFPEVELKFVDSDQPREDVIRELQDAVALITRRSADFRHRIHFETGQSAVDSDIQRWHRLDGQGGMAELGVNVSNNGGANAVAVAEHAVLFDADHRTETRPSDRIG